MKLHNQFDLSLVLACYNEAEHFSESLSEIIRVLDNTDWTYEIILIDDESQDTTKSLIQEAVKKFNGKHIRGEYNSRNLGRGATVSKGFEKSQGRMVGFIDFDLEVPAWYMPQFIEAIDRGYDVAIGSRIYDLQLDNIPRWIASKGYMWLRKWVLNLDLRDTEAGYKFFKREAALELIDKCTNPHWFWDTEISYYADRGDYSIKEIPVAFVRRKDKTSTVDLIPDTIDYFKALIEFRLKRGGE